MRKIVPLFVLVVLLSACGASSDLTRGQLYPGMYEEKPVTLLVMPPINNSANVEAKELLYTSISRPLAEAGYYVIPPSLAMAVLRQESGYDAELFLDKPLKQFHEFFGADAVVFSVIESWAKQGLGINTEIRYIIKSALTDQVLFDRTCNLFLDLSVNSGSSSDSGRSLLSILVDVAAGAINTALTDHIEAARKANYYIFRDLPVGKYDNLFLQDQDVSTDPQNVTKYVKE
ncbi:MAG: DUF799 family lipoprotein [Bacteroidales bacterium]|jgi:hypothetical protein|nr:DUF799 family lipoprotein [Bacteroidales bacterium]